MGGSVEAVEQLKEAARSQTGLSDFGDDSYEEGLERLVNSLRTEAKMSEVGEMVIPIIITGLLAQRLHVEDWYARHPEIEDTPLIAPLIGLSLPRTGSTALSALLAEDPNARYLHVWESSEPCPPPSTVTESPDPRLVRAIENDQMQAEAMPRVKDLVPSEPDGPMECQYLMGLDFKTHFLQAFVDIPSYSTWFLYDADLTSTYEYERRVLKLLAWGQPERPWRLKCPSHLPFIDDLDQVFPDAHYVMTHRDPTQVMVSVADLYEEFHKVYSSEYDPTYLADLNIEHWSVGMERTMAFRKNPEMNDRFYDIAFLDMQADPIGEVRGLYDWLGEPVVPAFEAGMEDWWKRSNENRTKTVSPPPEYFGMNLDEVAPKFADYNAKTQEWLARQGESRMK